MATASVDKQIAQIAGIESGLKQFISRQEEKLVGSDRKVAEHGARLLALEQRATAHEFGAGFGMSDKSLGETVTESEGFQHLKRGSRESGKIKIGSFHDKTITTTPGLNQPLVPEMRLPGIIGPGLRPLTVRDLLAQYRSTSNLIAYTIENVFTNSAAPQAGEGVAKGESNITFTLQNAPVQTLAHWIAASVQVLDDAPALAAYINQRMMYGLKLAEETQLLTGDGTGQNLSGLITNATAYNRGTASGDTDIDVIRKAKTQVRDSFFEADGVIINPHDWERIELTKTTYGEYIASVPKIGAPPMLWGMNVVSTPAIPVGKFLCGAFRMAAAVWDRWDATIEVSREHADFFTRNLVAILCEERLALTVFRPLALVYGTLPQLGS